MSQFQFVQFNKTTIMKLVHIIPTLTLFSGLTHAQNACREPARWRGLEYVYKDGIYYHTWVQSDPYGSIQGRLLCPALGGKDAMPYNEAEYESMKEAQNMAIQTYLNSAACVSNPKSCEPQNGADNGYMFFMGIEDYIRDEREPLNESEDSLQSLKYANYYYYEAKRTGSSVDYFSFGPQFNETSWWMKGYPTNEGINPINNIENAYAKHVVQVGDTGLMNVDYTQFYADGVNCMYVCPGY